MELETLMELCVTARFFGKTFFAPKVWEMDQKRFFGFKENFVIKFYWIFSIMKIFIVCCVPAQFIYLGKNLFVRYRPKCCQSDCEIFKSTISPEQMNKTVSFFARWYKFTKVESCSKSFGWVEFGWVRGYIYIINIRR